MTPLYMTPPLHCLLCVLSLSPCAPPLCFLSPRIIHPSTFSPHALSLPSLPSLLLRSFSPLLWHLFGFHGLYPPYICIHTCTWLLFKNHVLILVGTWVAVRVPQLACGVKWQLARDVSSFHHMGPSDELRSSAVAGASAHWAVPRDSQSTQSTQFSNLGSTRTFSK